MSLDHGFHVAEGQTANVGFFDLPIGTNDERGGDGANGAEKFVMIRHVVTALGQLVVLGKVFQATEIIC